MTEQISDNFILSSYERAGYVGQIAFQEIYSLKQTRTERSTTLGLSTPSLQPIVTLNAVTKNRIVIRTLYFECELMFEVFHWGQWVGNVAVWVYLINRGREARKNRKNTLVSVNTCRLLSLCALRNLNSKTRWRPQRGTESAKGTYELGIGLKPRTV